MIKYKKLTSLSWLSMASILVQSSSFVATLLLIKMYSPAHFGNLSAFLSLISILGFISTFNLDYAIVLSKSENDSKITFHKIFTILCIFTFIYTLIFSIIYNQYSCYYPIGIFLITLNQLFEYYLIKNNRFKNIALSKIISISTIIFQYYFGLIHAKDGLILGFLVGQFLSCLYLFCVLGFDCLKLNFSWKSLYNDNLVLVNFGFPSNLIDLLAHQLIPILILSYFSSFETGIYFLAAKLLASGALLTANSYSKIFHSKAVQLYNHQKLTFLYQYSIKSLKYLSILAFMFCTSVYIFSYFAIPYLDKKWLYVPVFILILTPYFMMRIIFNPFSFFIEILRINKTGLYFNILLLSVTMLGIGVGIYLESIKIGLFVLSIGNAILIGLIIYYIFNYLKKISVDI